MNKGTQASDGTGINTLKGPLKKRSTTHERPIKMPMGIETVDAIASPIKTLAIVYAMWTRIEPSPIIVRSEKAIVSRFGTMPSGKMPLREKASHATAKNKTPQAPRKVRYEVDERITT